METRVKIILEEALPNLDLSGIKVESGEAGKTQSIPLYLAVHLAKLNLCRIACPSWLSVDHLNTVLLEELQTECSFAPGLPIFYYEIFNALDGAGTESVNECRSVITRICLKRCQKIRSRQIVDFQYAGSAEIKFSRMIILGAGR